MSLFIERTETEDEIILRLKKWPMFFLVVAILFGILGGPRGGNYWLGFAISSIIAYRGISSGQYE
ncbi:MAG: hypothetical protein NUV91_05125, partial [Candidatus Omnitrophica bacterium]|nr:hypothetical protein [Candidatus Omnitrophota bacterium]